VASAGTVTCAQKHVQGFSESYIISPDYFNHKRQGLVWFFVTIILGVFFLFIQYYEYYELNFTFADSGFGSCFFIITGFHGLHVLIGVVFLSVACYRLSLGNFRKRSNHFNVTAAIWYWHFVDVV